VAADIEKIRSIWEETIKSPDPQEAIDLISESKWVKGAMGIIDRTEIVASLPRSS
jgi:hypothetical protein